MIYLDHHAATPMPAAVRRAMQEAACVAWANPSSAHAAGRASRQLLEDARTAVAESIGANAPDIVLTAGGTEACNLGIRGLAAGCKRVVSSDIEHPAVSESVLRLERGGRERVTLGVRRGRPPSVDELASQIDGETLVAMQWVNHETGTVFPIEAYGRVCRERGARLFVDATQALGKLEIDTTALGAQAIALAGQKVGGPAGGGACWVARGVDLQPVLAGGPQERGRRPGTPDTLSLVGFGAACRLVGERLRAQPRIEALRDRIEAELVALGGTPNATAPRAGTVTNLSFRGWEGPLLVAALDLEGVCVSAGAACSSGLQEPSPVLLAMYPDEQWRAGSAVRISLGIETSPEDIEAASRAFRRVLARSER